MAFTLAFLVSAVAARRPANASRATSQEHKIEAPPDAVATPRGSTDLFSFSSEIPDWRGACASVDRADLEVEQAELERSDQALGDPQCTRHGESEAPDMDTAGSAPWYRLVGSLVHETEAVPMPLPVPPKTELAEAQRSEASSLLRNYNTPQDLVRPTEVCATQIADSKTAELTDLFSISSDFAGSWPHCASFIWAQRGAAAAVAWHAEPHHALTDELYKTDEPLANPPVDILLSIDLPSPSHFPFISGQSSSAPGRTRQRIQVWAALLLLGAFGVLLSEWVWPPRFGAALVRWSNSGGRLVQCRTGSRRGAWLLLLAVKKKRVEGRRHAASSVHWLASTRALRVGIVIIFFLQGVCGTPAAPLQPVSVSSPCSLTDGGLCATSPNYPNSYGINEACTISGVPLVELETVAFNVEAGDGCRYDYLTVNGVKYCGTSGPSGAVAEDGVITWRSDGSGDAIANVSIYLPPGDVEIIESMITNCRADYSGGVVFARDSGAVSIINSTVTGCSAGQEGGVVYAIDSGAVSLIGSPVTGCSAEHGGVVSVYENSGAVSIIGSTVSGCSAIWYGGVVFVYDNSGAVSIIDSDVRDCSAGHSGGVVDAFNSGAVSIINSTVTGCSAGQVRRVELAALLQSRTAAGREMEKGHGCLTPLSPRNRSPAASWP
ncbi:hypothetical protein EMIHUDRAFT_220409 [Emiliania huxleyi CCMP1516]|uniref:CUB domain-containing protein n=2 Tax=Emiliania huxleyi TaxID=2903 RepID=A0A0D3I131_EMIH1|nr:hypothetical protein EMIHUDRAFT_220409 [Emiliania huxleyi CCMP1516]EOD04966.1 hypothetical protein EMIHUDRAFT_220409 [Emiliania huxleyi CCMP1516]|eukprot:XP_005757395.1 hypothetical protein EMIHUDRAFT_220409 [Emiliania huxleyi CCMP1516]